MKLMNGMNETLVEGLLLRRLCSRFCMFASHILFLAVWFSSDLVWDPGSGSFELLAGLFSIGLMFSNHGIHLI